MSSCLERADIKIPLSITSELPVQRSSRSCEFYAEFMSMEHDAATGSVSVRSWKSWITGVLDDSGVAGGLEEVAGDLR